MSDTITAIYDTHQNYITSSVLPDQQIGNVIRWHYSNLLPGEVRHFTYTLYIPTTVTIGTPIFDHIRIDPIPTDIFTPDNGVDLSGIAIVSWDPNFKSCHSSSMLIYGEGNIQQWDTLHYTIGFQNTGNDTAFTVVVRDTLPAEIDPLSVTPGASSHSYSYSLIGTQGLNIIEFRFNNILLPDSTRNEPASHGVVSFTCKLKPNIPPGTVIYNLGNNYFDFNAPVATNYTNDTLFSITPLSIVHIGENGFSIAPNPTAGKTTIRLSPEYAGGMNDIVLTDAMGRVILTKHFSGSAVDIDLATAAEGMYICAIHSNEIIIGTTRIIKN
jgi:uncharacterized repeat protein (TIGR01451 family)